MICYMMLLLYYKFTVNVVRISSVIGTTVVRIASDINKISCRFSNAVIDFKVMYKSSNFYVYFLARLYESTGRAIAVTSALALAFK